MKITCLHTIDSNAALFDAACPAGVTLEHHVRADLLQRAITQGEADAAILAETEAVLAALSGDAVLLTCTTLAPAAAAVGAVRVDAALAKAAAAEAGPGGVVDALITIQTTEAATRAIFEGEAAKTGALVRVTLVEGALGLFQRGDLAGYADLIAATAERSEGDVVALAQASMAPAAARAGRKVITSPETGLAAAIAKATDAASI